ncbi:TonB-dependent receptor [Methylobacillus sp.]|uniref:TonB-dependent receptor n=1 Tax=Methylobacillus sp. TaxID=56818 RepID=UPI0012CC9181|nr:TonB-dependent receptor [Methylobacillus sp.]MPS48959.1 TonB-dependent receptor [Methylobacillus sp.]
MHHKKYANPAEITPMFARNRIAFAVIGTLITVPAFAETASTKNDKATPSSETSQSSVTTEAKPKEVESSLGNIVVTAQRREDTAQNIATAISVLDGDEFIDRGIGQTAGEILNNIPNASAYGSQHSRPRWWIRGVGAGQQQIDFPSPVGVYLDDVYISNASATGFPVFDLAHVEVLRGPQGTLWGKNTTGGAINIISKKPSFETEGYARADIGSYGNKTIQAAIGGALLDERIAGRISVYSQDHDGYFKNIYNGKKSGGLTDTAVRGQLLFQLTPDLDALLNLHYRDYEEDGSNTSVRSLTGVYRNWQYSDNKRHVGFNAPSYADQSQYGGSLTLNWQLGDYKLTSITAYEDWQRQSESDSDNTPLEYQRGYSDAKSKQWTQELRLASPREDRLNWITGLYYFWEDIDSFSATGAIPGTLQAQSYNSTAFKHKAESFAIFGSTTYQITDRFDTTIGARWTTEKKKLDFSRRHGVGVTTANWGNLGSWWSNYNGTVGNPISGVLSTFDADESKKWNAFTYDITPKYEFSDTSRGYFKYAHGIKSGGFNTAAALNIALNDVKQEELDAYELGYKSEWLDGRLNFNATAFYYDYQNVQVNVVGPVLGLVNQTVSYMQNADKASVKGLELEVEALPSNRFYIRATAGLQDSEFKDFNVVNNGPNYDGNELVRTPNFNTQIYGSYTFPLANGNKIVFSADYRYVGHQFYYVNAQNAAQNVNYGLLSQDSYSITNARLIYSTRDDKVSVTGYVNNLFEKDFRAHAVPGVGGATNQWSEPRTVGVALTLRY